MVDKPTPPLTGHEPRIQSNSGNPLTGDEPVLGGFYRIDPRVLDALSQGRWLSIHNAHSGNSQLSKTERRRYARALIERLKMLDVSHLPPVTRDPRGPILLMLGMLGEAAALPWLVSNLRSERFRVRRCAIQGLGHLGNPGGIPPLLDLLEEVLQDNFGVSPFLVVDALGQLGQHDPDLVVPRLLKLLYRNVWPDLKLYTLVALGRIADPRSATDLIHILRNHSDFRHRKEAARALGRLESEEAYHVLVDALSDRYRDVRYTVAATLGYRGDDRAVPALQAAHRRERVLSVREGMEQALNMLGTAPLPPDMPVPLPLFDGS